MIPGLLDDAVRAETNQLAQQNQRLRKSTGVDRATSERVSGAASAPCDVNRRASFDSPRFELRECVLSSVSVSDKVFHIHQRRGAAGPGRAAGSGRALCRVGCSLYLVYDAPVVWLLSDTLPHQRHDLATGGTEPAQRFQQQTNSRERQGHCCRCSSSYCSIWSVRCRRVSSLFLSPLPSCLRLLPCLPLCARCWSD